ncbi:MAG: DUF4316 domain-containing protein [Eubacterium sp.]
MMKPEGEKIRKWDEISGLDEKTSPPDQTPAEAKEGPMRAYGQDNYLKTAEEQIEDDYNSIDGIVNNGSRRDTDAPEEKNKGESPERKNEAEKESVRVKIREHEERLRNSASDPARFRKDTLCPDRELC